MLKKVINNETLSKLRKSANLEKKRIVLCHGTFDLIHLGHIKHFKSAKKYGEILVVSITAKKYIKKGLNRPFYNDDQRIDFLKELNIVDFIYIDNSYSSASLIKKLKPDYYVKGSDYKKYQDDFTGKILIEKEAVEKNGGKLIFTDEITFSSSQLINSSTISNNILKKIKDIKKQHSFEKIKTYFEKIKDLNVLVIGDTIIDKYINVNPLGKPSKELIMATQLINEKKFIGGVFGTANNIANYCNNVSVLSISNNNKNERSFILKKISKKIDTKFFLHSPNPTTTKTRFIHNNYSHVRKLFEVYDMNDTPIKNSYENKILKLLNNKLGFYDIVLVNDYGHGLMTEKIRKLIERKSKFLSLNCQINAGNEGFNLITKYNKANNICIDLEEAKKAINMKYINIQKIPEELFKKIQTKYLTVTLGSKGSLTATKKNKKPILFEAFTNKIKDTMGAGDAYFAYSSLILYITKDIGLSSFIGNLAGSLSVNIEGPDPIKEIDFINSLNTYFKS